MSIPADLSSDCGSIIWDIGECDSYLERSNDSVNLCEIAAYSSNQPTDLYESSNSNGTASSKNNGYCHSTLVSRNDVVGNILDNRTSSSATKHNKSPASKSAALSNQMKLIESRSKDSEHRDGDSFITDRLNQAVNYKSCESDSGTSRQLSSRSCKGKKFKYVPGVTEEAAELYSMHNKSKSWPELEEEGKL